MIPVFYSERYIACQYAFDTTRKSTEIAESLRLDPIEGVEVSDPSSKTEFTEALIEDVHLRRYVDAVRRGTPRGLAESQGFTWDKGVHTMAVAHNTGLVAATDVVLDADGPRWAGSLSSGLHHASFASGKGFCTYNGLAVAAQHAHNRGAKRILVIDFDAHCGGGTYGLIRHFGGVQIDVSVSSFDHWQADEDDRESDLEFSGTDEYLDKIEKALKRASRLGPWDFVLYNAGMDPFNNGISTAALRERERMVAEWSADHRAPTVVTLAGGYTGTGVTMDKIVSLHRMTFEEFAKAR